MGGNGLKGENISELGDQAHADYVTQADAFQMPDLTVLARELKTLAAEASRRARTDEERASVEHVVEAEKKATSGNLQTALNSLKAAGSWALEIAKATGTEIAAKVIANQLGVR